MVLFQESLTEVQQVHSLLLGPIPAKILTKKKKHYVDFTNCIFHSRQKVGQVLTDTMQFLGIKGKN
jgi:hypothetical protein